MSDKKHPDYWLRCALFDFKHKQMAHHPFTIDKETIDSIHAAIAKDKEENNSSCTTET